MLEGNDSKWKYKFLQRRNAEIIPMECCQLGKRTQALMSKHVIIALLHRNGRPSACLTLSFSPSRSWADNHITPSLTINHIVLSGVAQSPQVNRHTYQAEYFTSLEITLQEPRKKLGLSLSKISSLLHSV